MADTKRVHYSVPLPLEPMAEEPWEKYVALLKQMGAERVFLCAPGLREQDTFGLERFEEISAKLADRTKFFHQHGMEAGVWLSPILDRNLPANGEDTPYQTVIGPEGQDAGDVFCPLDEGFQTFFCKAIQTVAKSGVDAILLEDDFRLYTSEPDAPFNCFCPLHLENFRKRSGMNLTREEIVQKVLCGKPNTVRDLWQATIGNSLMELAGKVERAVHAVNPTVRIGPATVISQWSHEGIEMPELLKKFAGNTRPIMRAADAPTWPAKSMRYVWFDSYRLQMLGWFVESHRLQMQWLDGLDVEVMADGDTNPRTRYHTTVATMHAFQQGLLASGITGMLNYGISGVAAPDHELGYVEKTAESLKHYEALCEFFPTDYVDSGVTALETRNNFKNLTLPDNTSPTMMAWPDESATIHHLSRMGIPIAYGREDGPVLLAGYSAYGFSDEKLQKLLKRGVVLDAVSAGWLTERGFDVGVTDLAPQGAPRFERYDDPEFCGKYIGQHIWQAQVPGPGVFYKYDLRPGARVITQIVDGDSNPVFPGVIHYENADGCRICLLPFDMYKSRLSELHQIMLSYARQEQLTRSLAWVGREPLTVTVNSQPNVHVICRMAPNMERVAIAVQNTSMDTLDDVVLRLNPRICVGEEIELLLPGEDTLILSKDFHYENDGEYGYLTVPCVIPAMEMLSVGICLK